MSDTNGSADRPRYQVSFAGDAAEMGREALRQAFAVGLGPAFRVRMVELLAGLQTSPLEMGEPLYDLRHARMQVRKAVKAPIILYYGVHESARQVFIQRVEFLPPFN